MESVPLRATKVLRRLTAATIATSTKMRLVAIGSARTPSSVLLVRHASSKGGGQ